MVQSVKYLELSNHVKINYCEKGDAKGVALILLPGYADSWRTFELMLPYLPESIHTFALTQRGHGDSSCPEHGYHTDDFVTDLLMFMDALHIEKAVILGASSGGFVARRFAINYPERVWGLVLAGSPSTLHDNPVVQKMWDTTISKLKDPVDPEFVRSFTSSTISHPLPQEFLDMIMKENMKLPAKVWRETFEGMLDEEFPGELSKIKAPTLLIWGDQDKILARNDQEALFQAITKSRLLVYPGVGHMLYWEKPDVISSDIIAFITEITERVCP